MSDAPERIWATEDADNYGEDRFHSALQFRGGTEYVRTDLARAELEAAVLAERVTLDQVISEADEIRNTFCLGLPGTDAEFKAWIHGFDTAVAHFAAAIRSRGEPV